VSRLGRDVCPAGAGHSSGGSRRVSQQLEKIRQAQASLGQFEQVTQKCSVARRGARFFGLGLLVARQVERVELFPKQDGLADGPGSLIRMPFGVHRLTGRCYGFYTADGSSLAPTIREHLYTLRAPETVPEASFEAYRSFVLSRMVAASPELLDELAGTVSERIKASVTVLEFVSQYVDLKQTASGAIGLCLFHDDHRPSFGMNTEGNYWHSFAGCGGGSVIDSWMKWRKCDFTTAVRQLARMVL